MLPKLINNSISVTVYSLMLLAKKICENSTRNLLTITLGSDNVCPASIKTLLLNVGCRRAETYLTYCAVIGT